MRNFFLPYRPLPRKVIAACHLIIQLGVMAAGGYWLVRDGLEHPWQHWAIGLGAILVALVAVRLLGELWMLPHYVRAQLSAASGRNAIITRSFDKRPGTRLESDDAIGAARVVQQDAPTTRAKERASREKPPRTEPRL